MSSSSNKLEWNCLLSFYFESVMACGPKGWEVNGENPSGEEHIKDNIS